MKVNSIESTLLLIAVPPVLDSFGPLEYRIHNCYTLPTTGPSPGSIPVDTDSRRCQRRRSDVRRFASLFSSHHIHIDAQSVANRLSDPPTHAALTVNMLNRIVRPLSLPSLLPLTSSIAASHAAPQAHERNPLRFPRARRRRHALPYLASSLHPSCWNPRRRRRWLLLRRESHPVTCSRRRDADLRR